eukprot:ctg_1176.g449
MPAVAIAALWVASKVHERSPGKLDVWVSEWPAPPISAPDGPDTVGSLSPALVMAVEAVLLDTLGWELVPVTPYHFAVVFIQAYAVQCEGVRRLAMQLCDAVMSAAGVMGSCVPSAVGLGCLIAAMRIREYQPGELTAKDAVHASAWQRWLLQSARWEGAGALEPVVASALSVSEWLLAGDGYRASPTTPRTDCAVVAGPIACAGWTLARRRCGHQRAVVHLTALGGGHLGAELCIPGALDRLAAATDRVSRSHAGGPPDACSTRSVRAGMLPDAPLPIRHPVLPRAAVVPAPHHPFDAAADEISEGGT